MSPYREGDETGEVLGVRYARIEDLPARIVRKCCVGKPDCHNTALYLFVEKIDGVDRITYRRVSNDDEYFAVSTTMDGINDSLAYAPRWPWTAAELDEYDSRR